MAPLTTLNPDSVTSTAAPASTAAPNPTDVPSSAAYTLLPNLTSDVATIVPTDVVTSTNVSSSSLFSSTGELETLRVLAKLKSFNF